MHWLLQTIFISFLLIEQMNYEREYFAVVGKAGFLFSLSGLCSFCCGHAYKRSMRNTILQFPSFELDH